MFYWLNKCKGIGLISINHICISVSNAINGQLKIVNLNFQDDYSDHDSQAYKALRKDLEEGIKESISEKDVVVKVLTLR